MSVEVLLVHPIADVTRRSKRLKNGLDSFRLNNLAVIFQLNFRDASKSHFQVDTLVCLEQYINKKKRSE